MKKTISILAFSSTLIASGGVSFLSSCSKVNNENHKLTPQVRQIRKMNTNVPNIIVGDFRLQILDDSTVRFEYKYQNPIYGTYNWLDDDTLFVPNRTLYPGPTNHSVTSEGSDVVVRFSDITIHIPKNIDSSMEGIKVYQEGITEPIYVTKPISQQTKYNTGELPKPENTGNVFEFIDFPRIIEPVLGYSEDNKSYEAYKPFWNKGLKENCGFEIQQQKDIYLTFPHKNGKALRQQYRNLAGAPEMVRLSTLGAWDSRYYPYNEQTAQEEVDHYYENDLPLDNLIIDTDWRAGFDGKGYFVNETLFPNMPRFLKSMHDQNIDVCFNDHPEPQKDDVSKEELPVLDPKEVQFRRYNLSKILNMGLDTWWYDRNWSTSLICPGGKTPEHENWLNHETWGDYLYNNVTKQTYLNHALDKYAEYGMFGYRRPTTMSNIVQIRNGNWEGFTDSMSHRYSIQWTGDQNYAMLPTEVANVVRTGNDCMPYMSSDLAGHNRGVADDYYYQRWMEYGALSPIFRIHCTRDLEKHCQPWYRPDNVIDTFRDWIKLRYRLLPLYYSLAKEAYDTCLPICRALSLEYQDDPNTHGIENEWLIGSNILFAPCTAVQTDTLEGDSWGQWQGDLTAKLYPTKDLSGKVTETTETKFSAFNNMRQYFIDKGVSKTGENSSAKITGKFKANEDRLLSLRSDDGCRFTIKDAQGNVFDEASDWTDHEANRYLHGNKALKSGETYTIEIDYYNAGNEGWLYFAGTKPDKRTYEDKKVYLPKGDWYNVFNGQTYSSENGQEVTVKCPVNENALFIKLGTMLPLIDNAQNTKELDWSNLTYDVYPTNRTSSFSSSLYEDDFETVAYQNGWYHNSPYNCYYDAATGEYVIKLSPSEGWYIGDDVIANRRHTIRLHKVNGLNFGTITLDGKLVTHPNLIQKDENIRMPFNFAGYASKTEDIVEIIVPNSSVRMSHEIRVKVVA